MGHRDGMRVLRNTQQLRDSKIEQLQRPILRHQNVGRLQVPMDDQVLVRGVDRCTHPPEEGEPLPDR